MNQPGSAARSGESVPDASEKSKGPAREYVTSFRVLPLAAAAGIAWGLFVAIITFGAAHGYAEEAFNAVSSLYLHTLSPGLFGAVVALGLGFADGAIWGAVFALLYNALARTRRPGTK